MIREFSGGGVVYRKLKTRAAGTALRVPPAEPCATAKASGDTRLATHGQSVATQRRVAFLGLRSHFGEGGGDARQNSKLKIEWLVVQHSGHKGWIFPKGLAEERESLKEAAVREVEEEAGIKAKVLEKIGSINLFFYKPIEEGSEEKQKIFQTATFYLMEYASGKTENHGWETSEAVWLPYEKARERLSFKSSKEILDKARVLLEERERQPKLI